MLDVLMTIGIMLILNGVTLYLATCEKYTIFCEEKIAYLISMIGSLLLLNVFIWKAVMCFCK